MRPTKRLTPLVDGLEPRIALSGVPTVAPLISSPSVQISGRARGAALFGEVLGHSPIIEFQLRGMGAVSPMGRVAVKAKAHYPGFNGEPVGQVMLANPFGEAHLEVTERSPTSQALTYHFVVSSATGRFTSLSGAEGDIVLRIGASGPSNLAPFQMRITPPNIPI